MPGWTLVVHGGAGVIASAVARHGAEAYLCALREALDAGRHILAAGGSALDAVEVAVRVLEDSPLFNAGRGSVFAADGTHRMEASLQDGRTRQAGAVLSLQTTRNPISGARAVMERTRHVALADADAWLQQQGLEQQDASWFDVDIRREQLLAARAADEITLDHAEAPAVHTGTVGAVARDASGGLAAATSTGGMTNKKYGRVGDVPIIGAGTYASNDAAAISCTGHGEEFIRRNVAHEISALVRYEELTLDEAVRVVLEEQLPDGAGGVIAVSPEGELSLRFTSGGMARGSADASGHFDVSIF